MRWGRFFQLVLLLAIFAASCRWAFESGRCDVSLADRITRLEEDLTDKILEERERHCELADRLKALDAKINGLKNLETRLEFVEKFKADFEAVIDRIIKTAVNDNQAAPYGAVCKRCGAERDNSAEPSMICPNRECEYWGNQDKCHSGVEHEKCNSCKTESDLGCRKCIPVKDLPPLPIKCNKADAKCIPEEDLPRNPSTQEPGKVEPAVIERWVGVCDKCQAEFSFPDGSRGRDLMSHVTDGKMCYGKFVWTRVKQDLPKPKGESE